MITLTDNPRVRDKLTNKLLDVLVGTAVFVSVMFATSMMVASIILVVLEVLQAINGGCP
jgi:hypothetical protein